MAKLVEFPSPGVKKDAPMYEESKGSPFSLAVKALFQRDDLKPLTFSESADGRRFWGSIIIPPMGVIPVEDKVLYIRMSDDMKEVAFWKELH